MTTRSTILFAFLATSLLAVGCEKKATEGDGEAPPAGSGVSVTDKQLAFVKTQPVEPDAGDAAIITTGRVAYDEDHVARLSVPISGRIAAIKVRPGDEVKPNTILAVVNSPDVAAAEASLAQDKAQRIQAEQADGRAERLLQSGAGSQREVEEAKANLEQARAAEQKDVAMLRVLGNGSTQPNPVYDIRSPIAGTLTERHATLGGPARADDPTPLFVVADLKQLWVLVDVFEQDVGLVRKEAKVDVTVPAYPDQTFHGTVAQVGDTVDPSSRTVKVRIAMPNPDSLLKPEMFARVSLQAVGHSAARIPASSVLTKADKNYVFVEDADKHYVRREVVLGAREGDRVQVMRGLAPNEKVVTQGGLLLDAEMGQRILPRRSGRKAV